MALGAVLAALVTQYRARIGWGMALLAGWIGFSRMTAHVHHAPDFVGGLVIGYLGTLLALILWRWVIRPRLSGNLREITR